MAAAQDWIDVVAAAARELDTAGVPSPRFDAEELAAHVAGVERKDLRRAGAPTAGVLGAYGELVARRARREPLQHLTGVAWFRHIGVAVGPGVFVPRPETELVAGFAIERAREVTGHIPVVVDLCTGSGVIARSVADEVPGARVHAVELGDDAVAWARRNLEGTTVDLRQGDMADAFPELTGRVDVVVSNPPYIPVGAVIRDAEVLAHDPALALWSGDDGLDAMRVVAATAARLLTSGGWVVAEHADLQGESAPAVFTATGDWVDVEDHRDLSGRPRYVTARRR